MNKIIVGLLVLSLTANTYLLLKPKEVIVQESEPEKLVVTETQTVEVQDKSVLSDLDSANKTITELKEQVYELRNELDLIKDREALAKLDDAIDADSKNIVENEVNQISEEALSRIKERQERVRNLFNTESVDASWAYQTQDFIDNAIREYGNTSAYNVEQLECKTSVCKITLKPHKQEQNGAVMAGLNVSTAIHASDGLRNYATNFQLNEDDGVHTTTMYLLKEKK